jgi:hypothetical protein
LLCIREHLLQFSEYSPTNVWTQSFRSLSTGTLNPPPPHQCIQLQFEMNSHYANTLSMAVKHFATVPRYLKGRESMIRRVFWCMNSFRWRIFCVYVVNFDFRNDKILTVTKFGTCVVDVLYQLWVKYYVVKICIVEFNHSVKIQNLLISGRMFIGTFWCDMNKS